jgi:hypothetical protein
LQRDCHPTRHFVKLTFVSVGVSSSSSSFSSSSSSSPVAGFILLENSPCGLQSSLRGMRIEDEFRGRGLSKLFMAIWLQLCLHMGLAPRANRIDKPLICKSLHEFGFRPCIHGAQGGNGRKRGVDVKLTRGSGMSVSA